MRFIVFTLLLSVQVTHADVLTDLKAQPASRYDLGILQLQFTAFIFRNSLRGQPITGTDFVLENIQIDQTDGVAIVVMAKAPVAQMKEGSCAASKVNVATMLNVDTVIRNSFSRLSGEQYDELIQAIGLRLVLQASEHSDFVLIC